MQIFLNLFTLFTESLCGSEGRNLEEARLAKDDEETKKVDSLVSIDEQAESDLSELNNLTTNKGQVSQSISFDGEKVQEIIGDIINELEQKGENFDYEFLKERLRLIKPFKFAASNEGHKTEISFGPYIAKYYEQSVELRPSRKSTFSEFQGFGAAPAYPTPPRCINIKPLLVSLAALQAEKRRESLVLMDSLSNRFLTRVLTLINEASRALGAQLDSIYNGLNSTVQSGLGTQLTQQKSNILSSISSGNTQISTAVLGAIQAANASITQIITDLSTTGQANIVAVVQDTTSTGLLAQLLGVLSTIPSAASTAVFDATQAQLAAIEGNISATNTALTKLMSDAITAANTSISNTLRAGIEQTVAEIIRTFNTYVLELVNSQNSLLSDWANSVIRLVRNTKRNEPLPFSTRVYEGPEPADGWNASLGTAVSIQAPANGLPLPIIPATQ